MNAINNLMDEEGENQALRMFLAYYGGACGVSVGKMQAHLRMAGFNGAWPEWCNEPNEDKQHLTKAGAQLWIRHLISLEALAQPIDTSPERVEKEPGIKRIGCVQHDCAECKAREAQPAREPVASIYISQNGEREMDDWKCQLPVGRNELYTAAPQPAREPLSNERIAEIVEYLPENSDEQIQDDPAKFIRDLIRQVERAHGIGGDK